MRKTHVVDYLAQTSGQIPKFLKAKTFITSKEHSKLSEQNTNTAFRETFCVIVHYLSFGFLVKIWYNLLRFGITCYTLNSVYNDYVYNDIPVIAIEFHGHDSSI